MKTLTRPLKQVDYTVVVNNNRSRYPTWDGTPLALFWNQNKQYFLPGQYVTIINNYGYSKTFVRGVKG